VTSWNGHLNDVVDGLLAMALWAWVCAHGRDIVHAWRTARPGCARASCNENAQWGKYKRSTGGSSSPPTSSRPARWDIIVMRASLLGRIPVNDATPRSSVRPRSPTAPWWLALRRGAGAGALAARELTGRVGWLAAVTIIVVLASSQLLFELAGYGAYALALRDAAYATIVGDPLTATGVLARVMEIVLLI
jgi:hypothetical protein